MIFEQVSKKVLVTGAAGFIGSHLIDKLIDSGHYVIGIDDFSQGSRENILHLENNSNFKFFKADLTSKGNTLKILSKFNIDYVFHFAANSDVRLGISNTSLDLQSTFMTTYNLLESMVELNIRKIVFASTSAVYGIHKNRILENQGPLFPTSLYGASKLASEGFISAYCEIFNFQSWIVRFPNVVGSRLTHGVIFDFINKLSSNPKELEVLGDGNQKKPYIHVDDLIDAIEIICNKGNEKINYFNVGPDDSTSVKNIAKHVVNAMNLSDVKIKYTGGSTGWPGDVPVFNYDTAKLKKLGWNAKFSSDSAVKNSILENI